MHSAFHLTQKQRAWNEHTDADTSIFSMFAVREMIASRPQFQCVIGCTSVPIRLNGSGMLCERFCER